MDIKQLRYFVEIQQCGSFSQAAERLYISQQGLSMAILRLESELACKLFKRTPKGLHLTEHGAYLLPRAQDIIRQFEACEAYFKENRSRTKGFKICAVYGAMPEFAGPIVFSFQQARPDFAPDVTETSDTNCETLVENEEVELGFGLGPMDGSKFDSCALFSLPTRLLVHTDHPLAQRKTVSVRDLRHLPVMMMVRNAKTKRQFMDCCRREGFVPEISYRPTEVISLYRLVSENRGVGISSSSLGTELHYANVRAIAFEEAALAWTVYLFKKRGCVLSAGAQAFERYLLQRMPPIAGAIAARNMP